MEYRRIGKSGGSLTVAIPAQQLAFFGLVKGDYVRVELKGEAIEIKPDYEDKGRENSGSRKLLKGKKWGRK